MEWMKGNLKNFTIKLEEITNIFVHKIGGQLQKIFLHEDDGKIYCYRNGSLSEEAKNDIINSIELFSDKKKKELIYKGNTYYVTDKLTVISI